MKTMLSRRILAVLLAVIALATIGTLGYAFLEGWKILDALYMTIITITTVGFQEVQPLSSSGRIFTIFLIGSSLLIVSYAVSYLASALSGGKWQEYLRRREMNMEIRRLKNHHIICGCGVVGREVIEHFTKVREPFVVIEKEEGKIREAEQSVPHFLYLLGDATREEILREAQIENAKSLLALVGSDPDNVYIVVTARYLNPHLRIVARVMIPESIEIMKKAGAHYAICPQKIGGIRLAAAVLRPHVSSFLDLVLRSEAFGLSMEEVEVAPHSPLVGQSLGELKLTDNMGIFVIAIKPKHSPIFEVHPGAQKVLHAEDILILLGPFDRIVEFQRSLAYPPSSAT